MCTAVFKKLTVLSAWYSKVAQSSTSWILSGTQERLVYPTSRLWMVKQQYPWTNYCHSIYEYAKTDHMPLHVIARKAAINKTIILMIVGSWRTVIRGAMISFLLEKYILFCMDLLEILHIYWLLVLVNKNVKQLSFGFLKLIFIWTFSIKKFSVVPETLLMLSW